MFVGTEIGSEKILAFAFYTSDTHTCTSSVNLMSNWSRSIKNSGDFLWNPHELHEVHKDISRFVISAFSLLDGPLLLHEMEESNSQSCSSSFFTFPS
jgi:hypothetical protein